MKQGSILREAATLVSGNILAQLIAFAAYFVLTRIYSPDDYGLFNIFYSYIEVLIILSTCKYELAVVVADDDKEAAAVSRFALRLNTLVSLGLLTIALVLWLSGALPGNFSQLGWMVLLIPPMVFFCGTSRIYSFLYNRFHKYSQIALSDNVNAGAGALLKILFGWLGMTHSGLPVGTVLGQAVANLNYRIQLRSLALPDTNAADSKDAARKHKNFPLYVATKDFVSTLSSNLPFLWLAIYFDRAEVGLFGLALTFTMQPVNLISTALERVFYTRAAEAVHSHQRIAPMLQRFILPLSVLAIIVCIVAWFIAEPVFAFCFGERWQGCGPYVQALLPWVLTGFISACMLFIPNVFSTQRTEFFFYLVLLALRVIAIIIGIGAADFLLAIRLFAMASATVYVALALWYLWQVRRYDATVR